MVFKFIFLLFLSCTLFASDSSVKKGLDILLEEAGSSAHIGLEVVSLTRALKLYEKNASHLFVPAGMTKLFTAAAALNLLKPNFCFETTLRTDGVVEEGVLKGNLYLIGSGDPTLNISDLEAFVLELTLREIKTIEGDLIVDHFIFDKLSKGPGWMWDELSDLSAVSGLTINHSCLNLWVKPAKIALELASLFSYPKTRHVQLINQAETKGSTLALKVQRPLASDNQTIFVKGEIPQDSEIQAHLVPIDLPHLYAGEVLKMRLERAGIKLKGSITSGKAPEESDLLFTHYSLPLNMLVQTMLKTGDHLYADHFFKTVGAEYPKLSAQGTWKNGADAVLHFLTKEVGLDSTGLTILDGSGLSRYNLTTPHQIVQLLSWVDRKSPYSAEFMAALPIAGETSAYLCRFKSRFKQQTDRHIDSIYNLGPRLRAMSDGTQGIKGLSGYIYTKGGEKLAFALLINGFVPSQLNAYKELENRICQFLANLD